MIDKLVEDLTKIVTLNFHSGINVRLFFELHLIAFILGFLIDSVLGDPHSFPHPIRLIGNGISFFEKKLYYNSPDEDRKNKVNFKRGRMLFFVVLGLTVFFVIIILMSSYLVDFRIGMIVESIMTYQVIAAKSLKVESMRVYKDLVRNDLDAGRKSVSMIVGRDTEQLDEIGVTKAAVETVAENTSDGVIAPLMYLAIGGPILGFAYKAVNTMDSMIGYKNDRYMFFGRFAAKADDVVNFVPARISGCLIIISCLFLGDKYNFKNALYVFKRDRFNHKSPNSAQTEAACAGALDIQLAGDAKYFGKVVKKPYIGDPNRKIEIKDIKRANNLMYMSAVLAEILGIFAIFALIVIITI